MQFTHSVSIENKHFFSRLGWLCVFQPARLSYKFIMPLCSFLDSSSLIKFCFPLRKKKTPTATSKKKNINVCDTRGIKKLFLALPRPPTPPKLRHITREHVRHVVSRELVRHAPRAHREPTLERQRLVAKQARQLHCVSTIQTHERHGTHTHTHSVQKKTCFERRACSTQLNASSATRHKWYAALKIFLNTIFNTSSTNLTLLSLSLSLLVVCLTTRRRRRRHAQQLQSLGATMRHRTLWN